MKATGIRGEGDIVFCANVCEEGLGDLRGIKHVFKDMANTEEHYDGFVSIDDKKTSGIIYQAVGSERYLVTFHGTGGHSFTGFGIPNPIHAMGRAIAKISDLQTPKNPKTTFSVGVVNGGTSVNVIAAECSMLVDMRSVDAGELEKLSAKLHQAIEEAVNEENARWGYGTLSSESTGTLDDNNMTAKSSVGDTAGAVPVNADNGSRENGQGGRKPDSENSAPYGESFPGFFSKGENPGNLAKKAGIPIHEGSQGSKTGCHALCPDSQAKQKDSTGNSKRDKSYGRSSGPCSKGSVCSVDGRRRYRICDLDPHCGDHWRCCVYREFPEQRAAECRSPGPYPGDPAVCQGIWNLGICPCHPGDHDAGEWRKGNGSHAGQRVSV